MQSDKKDKIVSYVSVGLAVFVMFAVFFAGYFFLFGDGASITGFAVAENQTNPLSLKLSVKDYSLGHPIEGRLLVGAGSYSDDLRLLVLVDYRQVYGVSLKELFDSNKVKYVVQGGKLISSTDLSVNLLEWNILTNYDYGIYKLKVKFSDDSFEDSANFDVIS
jgi:hypothetical protein